MVCVASCRHGQTANVRVLESVCIITAKSRRGVEDLNGIDRQRFQSGKTDPCAKQIIWMWRNSEAASLMDDVADLACRFSLQVRKLCAYAQKMPISGCDFHPRKNEKIIDGQAVQSHQSFLKQVIDRIACVVIGDGNAV